MSAPLRPAVLPLVALGGALGALLRFAVDSLSPATTLPWHTLAINVLGAFLLGVMPALSAIRRSHALTALLGPGVLGGFTTVSTWAGQVRDLVADGHPGLGGTYLVVTLAAGLGAAALGHHLAHRSEPEEALR